MSEIIIQDRMGDFVVELPAGYDDPDIRIVVVDVDWLVVTCAQQQPLMLNRWTQEISKIDPTDVNLNRHVRRYFFEHY